MVGARESKYTGGSLRMATLRILGTTLGALFGFMVLVIVKNPMPAAARTSAIILLLAAWVALLSKLRTIAIYSYGALVAQFSAYVVVFSTPVTGGDIAAMSEMVAWTRIEQNVLGARNRAQTHELRVEFHRLPATAAAASGGSSHATCRLPSDDSMPAALPLLLLVPVV